MEGVEYPTFATSEATSGPTHDSHVGAAISCHPDLNRVGESARLFDLGTTGTVQLSRSLPIFRDPQGSQTLALTTVRVSRAPLTLRMLPGGSLQIEAKAPGYAFLDEQEINESVTCSLGELGRGVLLRLGRHVLLRLGIFSNRIERVLVPSLIGQGAAMRRLRQDILRVADLHVPVMLRGETGVGKELVASALHELSPRRAGPYVCVNMAAIPPSMATAELFGHEKGAFTGAAATRIGYFAEANGGTLFLDEMGETASDVQPVLLRAIENGVIQPLGGKLRKVDVRLVAATDSNLESAAEEGRFSGALLRRFEYDIWIPPLRDRLEDLPELFVHFLQEAFASFGEPLPNAALDADRSPFLEADFMMRLMRHQWPGNVRELRAVARRVAIGARGKSRAVLDERLLAMLGDGNPSRATDDTMIPVPGGTQKRKAAELAEPDIIDALRRNGFRINPTALDLGVSRSWLHARMNTMTAVRKARDLGAAEVRAALAHTESLDAAAALLEVSARGLQLQLARLGLSTSAVSPRGETADETAGGESNAAPGDDA